MAKQRTFNLLKPVEPPPTIWDKIYSWILVNARIVILITELLIAFTFMGKVIEDTAAKNKDKEIQNDKAELAFYSTDKEPIFRNIQTKNQKYNIIWSNSTSYTNVLKEIYSYITNPGSEITIRITKSKVSIFGYEDLGSLKDLEAAMKSSPTFNSVFVDNLSLQKKEIDTSQGLYVLEAIINTYKRGAL